jgi:GAF domain-containing protein
MLTRFPDHSSSSLLQSDRGIIDCSEVSLSRSLPSLIQSIDEAPDIETAIAPIVTEVCEKTDWDYGEVWIPSAKSIVLELSPVWHIASDTADGQSLEQFRLCSEGFILSPGEGLPGRVWLSKQSEWIADATAQSESYCLRNQIARAFDIRAGFGMPIIANEQMQAVLVFFKVAS